MSDKLFRTSSADLVIRSDGRTVSGIAVPYDTPAEIRELGSSYTEVFRKGAFERTIRERGPARCKFLVQHQRERLPVGRATKLEERDDGLYAEFYVSRTAAGDELLTLIRDKAVDGLSIGFVPIRSSWSRDRQTCERTEVKLLEVSATAWPCYDNAAITGVRQQDSRVLDAETVARRLRYLDL